MARNTRLHFTHERPSKVSEDRRRAKGKRNPSPERAAEEQAGILWDWIRKKS